MKRYRWLALFLLLLILGLLLYSVYTSTQTDQEVQNEALFDGTDADDFFGPNGPLAKVTVVPKWDVDDYCTILEESVFVDEIPGYREDLEAKCEDHRSKK